MVFYESTYTFDGRLTDGSFLNQNAIWYVEAAYQAGKYFVRVNTLGKPVYLESGTYALMEGLQECYDAPSSSKRAVDMGSITIH